MWRIKRLADPDGILGPGIVLNRDPQVHLRNLKTTPEIEAVATKCIECGFCEPVCPSRNVTTTPRQRIVLRREMARQPAGSPVHDALLSSTRTTRSRPAPPTAPAARLPGGDRHRRAGQGTARRITRRPGRRAAARAGRALARPSGGPGRCGRRGVARSLGAARRAVRTLRGGWRRSRSGLERQHARHRPGRLPATEPAGRRRRLPAGLHEPHIRHDPRAAPGRPCPRRWWRSRPEPGCRCGSPTTWPGTAAARLGAPRATGRPADGRRTASGAAPLDRGRGRLPVVIDASSCTYGVVSELAWRGSRCSTRWPGCTTGCSTRLPVAAGSNGGRPSTARLHLGLAGKLTRSRGAWPTTSWFPPAPAAAGWPATGAGAPRAPALGAARRQRRARRRAG